MRKLTVKNFSVIKDAELEFGKITVLIGPQSSGKSLLCKLAYFLSSDAISIALNTAISGLAMQDYETFLRDVFLSRFPLDGWGTLPFSIHFEENDYSIKIIGLSDGSKSPLFQIYMSPEFVEAFSVISSSNSQLSGNAESSQEIVRASAWHQLMGLRSDVVALSELYIPAGRSFFINPDLGFSALQNPAIDPLTRRFASEVIWNPARWKAGLLTSGRGTNEKIDSSLKDIIGGSVSIEGNTPVFKDGENRILPLNFLSSGVQELLPLFNVLSRLAYQYEHSVIYYSSRPPHELNELFLQIRALLYLEEPEAHVFPETQKELVRIFSWLANAPLLNFSWVITTHSPYILTAFNSLIEAWRVGNKEGKREQVAALIPEQYWVNENDFAAYSIRDGKLASIFKKETEGEEGSGLIDGDFLDSVSDSLGSEFDKLLDIEYAD